MSRIEKCTLVICDGCGKWVVLRPTGAETVLDGGYTRIDHMESLEKGWSHFSVLNLYDLCPRCSAILKEQQAKAIDIMRTGAVIDRCIAPEEDWNEP